MLATEKIILSYSLLEVFDCMGEPKEAICLLLKERVFLRWTGKCCLSEQFYI